MTNVADIMNYFMANIMIAPLLVEIILDCNLVFSVATDCNFDL